MNQLSMFQQTHEAADMKKAEFSTYVNQKSLTTQETNARNIRSETVRLKTTRPLVGNSGASHQEIFLPPVNVFLHELGNRQMCIVCVVDYVPST